MKIKSSRPTQRTKTSNLQYAFEELKFIKSSQDLKHYLQNILDLAPRVIGNIGQFTPIPPSLQIEPTNYCNARCICCPTSRSTRKKGFMDIELFRNIVDEAADMGIRRVRIFLHGEPLLHPHIVDMIAYLKKRDMACHLTTNGMLLNHHMNEAILNTGVNCADHLTCSIYGSTKEVHEAIAKRVNYDQVIRNIADFMDLRNRNKINGPVVETIFYSMSFNHLSEKEYLHFWHGKVDHVRLGGNISESFSGYKKEANRVRPRTQTCTNLWERMTIFWNGDVTLCCQDVDGDWVFGNLNEKSIRDIWNSQPLVSIKKIHLRKKFQEFAFCHQCDM